MSVGQGGGQGNRVECGGRVGSLASKVLLCGPGRETE